jgi:hypothetical protein
MITMKNTCACGETIELTYMIDGSNYTALAQCLNTSQDIMELWKSNHGGCKPPEKPRERELTSDEPIACWSEGSRRELRKTDRSLTEELIADGPGYDERAELHREDFDPDKPREGPGL